MFTLSEALSDDKDVTLSDRQSKSWATKRWSGNQCRRPVLSGVAVVSSGAAAVATSAVGICAAGISAADTCGSPPQPLQANRVGDNPGFCLGFFAFQAWPRDLEVSAGSDLDRTICARFP